MDIMAWMLSYWYIMLIDAVVGLFIIGGLSLVASRFVGREPSSLGKLKASIYLTLALIIVAYLAIAIGIARLLGPGTGTGILTIAVILVAFFGILQWLFSPWLINLAYRAHPPSSSRDMRIQQILERASSKAGIRKPPKLRIVETMIPNAFAYGSPISGNYVAVTRGLIESMDEGEIEAVLGHELGHLKHRDVAWILALSIVPLALYFIGRSLIYASMFSTSSRSDREGNPGLYYFAIGVALIALGFATKLLVAHFNRLREYYADAFSTVRVGRGRELQRALAKIHVRITTSTTRNDLPSLDLARALYIVAPLIEINGGFFYSSGDSLVEAVKREQTNPVREILSTHPPVPKRLRFIDNLLSRMGYEVEY